MREMALIAMVLIGLFFGALRLLEGASERGELPELEFIGQRPDGRIASFARITVPEIPDCVSQIWCYEDRFGNAAEHFKEDGTLVLVHKSDELKAETRFIPLPRAVDVRLKITGPAEELKKVRYVNPCWQHGLSDLFGNRGVYPKDFAHRCFIFTVRGLTLMGETIRFIDTRHPADSPHNNPPWIQEYFPVWKSHPGQRPNSRGYSTDRAVLPIIGVVSRDGKYLQAWAWPLGRSLGQVWHDCLHPRPAVDQDYDPETNTINSHSKLYFLENDQEKLVKMYLEDFGPLEPSLSVEPEGKTLLIRSPDLPENVLRLTLPESLKGVTVPAAENPVWTKHLWGTLHAGGKSEDEEKNSACYFWVHPCQDFVDINVTVVNGGETLLTATVVASLYLKGAPALKEGKAAAILFWEGTQTVKAEGDVLRVGGQIPGIIPGAYRTLRGRVYFLKGSEEDLKDKVESTREEWQRARPYLLPPPK